jgi:hypothetical protein
MSTIKQAPSYSGEKRDRNSDFLFPLAIPLFQVCVSPENPLLVRLLAGVIGRAGASIPGIVVGGVDSINDFKAPGLDNLYVGLHIQSVENEVVAGAGVTDECWAVWESHSTAASVEKGGPVWWPLPPPGQMFNSFGPHSTIYAGLIDNGCGNTPSFPIEHLCRVGEWQIGQGSDSFVEIGAFHGVDSSTIQPTGYWTFAYTVRAKGTNGSVSDFKFRGNVPAICSSLKSL